LQNNLLVTIIVIVTLAVMVGATSVTAQGPQP